MNVDHSRSQEAVNSYFERKGTQKYKCFRERLVLEQRGDAQYLDCRKLSIKERVQQLFGRTPSSLSFKNIVTFCKEHNLVHEKLAHEIDRHDSHLLHSKVEAATKGALANNYVDYIKATGAFFNDMQKGAMPELDSKMLHKRNPDGNAWIHLACEKGKVEVVKALLEKDPSLAFIRGENGKMAFEMAAEYGQIDVMKLLYDHAQKEGKLYLVTPYIHEAMQCCISRGKIQELKECIFCDHKWLETKAGSGNVSLDTLFFAAACGDVEAVKTSIARLKEEKYVFQHATDKRGQTALHIAAANGHNDVVALLCAVEGADINAKDAQGHTPLMLACMNGREKVVDGLLNMGASLYEQDGEGNTCLHLAAKRGQIALLNHLNVTQSQCFLNCPKNNEDPGKFVVEMLLARGYRLT